MSQSDGSSTDDENQSHVQPEKSIEATAPEINSQEVQASSLSTSRALQCLEEVKTSPNLILHITTSAFKA
ncbi:hypothetical protein Baya_0436 [Bagarius yarrelli]|uniref:Uncharacterized protein n=1 Tax=Bagarius yarrelli TaxID=175774 RepID=A0A556TIA1_BAGYA|nr:hypothetical protein Baya_0436 [Bagarius yarrelli]